MVIVMKPNSTETELNNILHKIEEIGLRYQLNQGESRVVIGILGDKKLISSIQFNCYEGVEKTISITEKYKLVSREFKREDSVVQIKDTKVGGGNLAVMAGPCAVESKEQLREAALVVKASGAQFLRGGAFKPRTSPYDFQGLAEEGLKMMREVADEVGLLVVTEIVDINDLPLHQKYSDVLQVGARNMQNFQLLKAVGKSQMPVLLKRGIAATINEWLNAAEYIASEGNLNIILCERGIRTYETYTRNTLDLSAVAAVKELSHLPIIVDPSHGTGRWQMVKPMALAGVAAGADGLMIEVHPNPKIALSDGDQSLTPEHFEELMVKVQNLAAFLNNN